jgi:hypothetical protein
MRRHLDEMVPEIVDSSLSGITIQPATVGVAWKAVHDGEADGACFVALQA